ncbi:MAG: cellulose synthase subunit BcsC-related outer membrane protein, partial [Succinivibrio sp.]
GKILSYRQSTIRKGIAVLDYYADQSQDADKALRQALLWLEPDESDEKYYSAYLKRHPNDQDVKTQYDSSIIGGLVKKSSENSSNTDKQNAIRDFEKIIAKTPNNQYALEAVGYLHLELKNYVRAHEYLSKAASLGGSKQAKLEHDASIALVNQYQATGNYQAAITELDKILKANPYDADALLTKADILRKQGQKAQAELALTTLLAVDSANAGANEMLYYLYRESGKTKNANELLESMPIAVAEKIKAATAAKPYSDPIPPIRDKAKSHALSGNTADAIEVLQDGINKYPKSSWLRYDLARLLKKEGFDAGAFEQISYLTRNDASDEDLLAAATFMNEFKLYAQSMSTLGRVKNSNAKITDMKKEIAVNRTFAQVEMYLGSGNRQAALNTLRMNRYKNSELKDSQLSHLAYLYLKAGDSVTALSLAEEAASRPVKADASLADYADLITVFNETEHPDKALMFSSNEAILANSDYSDIEKLKIGESVRKADALRELKRYADAYDELYPHLKNSPENPDLRMAMARIYQDNGMYSESFSIYDKVLDTDPDNQQALNGAINSALADEDYETATDLAMRLKDTNDPRVLTLLARIDSKNKDYDDALIKLRKARALLDSRYDYSSSVNLKDPDLSVSSSKRAKGNPFANKSKASDIKSASAALPWEKKDSKTGEFAMLPAQRKDAINEINFMIRDLKDRVATTATVSLEGREKDGEDGMSKVKALSVPVTVSIPVLGGAKLSLTARMDSYNSGSLSTSSSSEFGTNALSVGVQNMVERINALKKDYQNAGSDPGNQHAFIVQNGLDSLSSSDLAVLLDPTMLNASDYNIQTAAGRQKLIEYFNSYSDPRAAMSAVNTAKNITTVMMDAKAKRSTGVGFTASLKDDRYKVDFGVTPVGKDGTTVVAGAFVRQPLTSFSELRVKAERSAMTDSLLSYFGYLDRLSGTYWGGVTKNGGLMEYAFDNGFLGTSLQANVYRYLGKNVRSNTS